MVKAVNKFFHKKEEAAAEETPVKSEEVVLLEQIRDALTEKTANR